MVNIYFIQEYFRGCWSKLRTIGSLSWSWHLTIEHIIEENKMGNDEDRSDKRFSRVVTVRTCWYTLCFGRENGKTTCDMGRVIISSYRAWWGVWQRDGMNVCLQAGEHPSLKSRAHNHEMTTFFVLVSKKDELKQQQ